MADSRPFQGKVQRLETARNGTVVQLRANVGIRPIAVIGLFRHALSMNSKTAYLAMYDFLCQRFRLSGSDELGALLGSMSLLPDGSPADAAMWADWESSVQRAENDDVDADLSLK